MDIPRKKQPKRGRWVALAVGAALAVVVSVAASRLRDAPPAVDLATVTVATAQRGPMVREVRAPGSLVPLDIRWITAETSGRVERITLRAGASVTADTILVELSNPDTLLAALQTESELASAEADLLQLSHKLQVDKLTQENILWSLKQDVTDAERRADAYERGKGSVFTELDTAQMKDKSDGLKKRVGILDRELRVLDDGLSTQVAAQIRQVRRRKDVAEFRKKQVEALRVRAAMDGVLSDMPLELGQWVVPGTVLAKVVKPERLKAVLRVSEVQAKDVAVGQTARIDTHSGVVSGHVARIAPAASQGTVIVDVLLDAELPPVARPDLNVDGIVEIDRLDDVVCVDRPVGAQEDRPLSVFRLTDDGKEAVRVTVAVGKLSLKTIEVKEGLREGARIIVSDMSRWDSASQLALH